MKRPGRHGSIGVFSGGLPRPSGAGWTRQAGRSGRAGGGGVRGAGAAGLAESSGMVPTIGGRDHPAKRGARRAADRRRIALTVAVPGNIPRLVARARRRPRFPSRTDTRTRPRRLVRTRLPAKRTVARRTAIRFPPQRVVALNVNRVRLPTRTRRGLALSRILALTGPPAGTVGSRSGSVHGDGPALSVPPAMPG